MAKLKSENKEDVISAILYFKESMDRKFLPNIITTYFEHPSREIKLEALETSVTIGALEIQHETQRIREYKIGEIDTSIYPVIEDALKNDYQNLKWSAVSKVKQLRLRRFNGLVTELLSHNDFAIRTEAALTIGYVGSVKDIPMLLELVKNDAEYNVGYNALKSIARLGTSRTLLYLKENLDDLPEKHRENTRRTMNEIATRVKQHSL